MNSYAYIVLEVGGIQKYILSTGKLKEMIGGSEIIASLGERCKAICSQKMLLREVQEPDSHSSDWYIVLQESGGTIRLLMAGEDIGKSFLQAISAYSIEHYADLPLYGVTVQCEWSSESLQQAAKEASQKISLKRNSSTLPSKGLWPFCKSATLDSLPVVTKDKEEYISASSEAKRATNLLNDARLRLQNIVSFDFPARWATDLEELLQNSQLQRIALIHIDGNSLGAAFRKRFETSSQKSPSTLIESLKKLSNLVDNANKKAFADAVHFVTELDRKNKEDYKEYIVPLRPLVLGGDDLTVIVRADLAFAFIESYTESFEKITKEKGDAFTVGAGMVVMQSSYPFVRAFHLVEQLTDSAKKMTSSMETRLSSLDYLILTNDVTPDLNAHRKQVATAEDGYILTGKPFFCGNIQGENNNSLNLFHLKQILNNAYHVSEKLPASHTREAISQCRRGEEFGKRAWIKLKENIQRELGGRKNKEKIQIATYERIFPESFYCEKPGIGQKCTLLGDYLELRSLNVFSNIKTQRIN